MALNKKGGFGLDLEDKFKDVESLDNVKPADKHTDTHTDAPADAATDTHTHTDTDTAPAVIENKTKRTYGLVQQSVFEKVTEYAKAHNTSYNAIVCDLLDEFIAKKGL